MSLIEQRIRVRRSWEKISFSCALISYDLWLSPYQSYLNEVEAFLLLKEEKHIFESHSQLVRDALEWRLTNLTIPK